MHGQSINPYKRDGNRYVKMKAVLKKLADLYGIKVKLFFTSPNKCGGSGCYVPSKKIIKLPKLSIITFLHELGHALDCQLRGSTSEPSARDFSEKIYFKVFPEKKYLLNGRPVGHSSSWKPIQFRR